MADFNNNQGTSNSSNNSDFNSSLKMAGQIILYILVATLVVAVLYKLQLLTILLDNLKG